MLGSWGRRRAARLSVLVVGLAGLGGFGAVPADANHEAGTASISGTVTDSRGVPVNTCVSASASTGGPEWHSHWVQGWTDEAGRYTVGGLPAGTYKVAFGCFGDEHMRSWYGGEAAADATPIELADGAAVDGIDGTLFPAPRLTGRVVDDTGVPQGGRGFHAFGVVDGTFVTTASDGTFTLAGVRPAEYRLHDLSGNSGAYPRQSEHGFLLASGRPVEGVEIVVPAKGSITGRALENGAAPSAPVCVHAVGPNGEFFGFKPADPTGAYRFDGVNRGPVTVAFSGCGEGGRYFFQFLGGASRREDAAFIDVAPHETTTVPDHELRLGGVISGVMTTPEGTAPVNGCIMASPEGSDPGTMIWGHADPATGQYRIAGLTPGNYAVTFHVCDQTDLLWQSYGGQPGEHGHYTPVAVAENAETAGIDMQLTRGAVITGTITHQSGSPVTACLSGWQDGMGWPSASAFTTDGAYQLGPFRAGTARVQFNPCGGADFGTEWWQDQPDRASATPIEVSLGQVVSGLDALVAPGAAVRGTIRLEGRPVQEACVQLIGSELWEYAHYTSTDFAGQYLLRNVGAGTYSVRVIDCANLYRFDAAAAGTVTVPGGEDVNGADFSMSPAAPVLRFVAPSSGRSRGGDVVSVVGQSLRGAQVRFGGAPASSVRQVGSFQVDAVAPPGEPGTTVAVTATTAGGSTSPGLLGWYTYDNTPYVLSVDPSSGPLEGGGTVRITGRGLADASAVLFGGVESPSFTVDGDALVATVPAGSRGGPVPVQVVTPRGTTDPADAAYAYDAPVPTISAVTPGAGPLVGGNVVTVTGERLGEAEEVRFGDTAASTFTVVDDTRIDVRVPGSTAVGFVPVRVTSPLGTSAVTAATQYEYVGPPAITGLSRDRGPEAGGETLVVTGAGFDRVDEVEFGGAAVPFTASSSTELSLTVPPGTDTVLIVARGVGGESNAVLYHYVPAPRITDVSPSQGGIEGGDVVLSGIGLEWVEQVTADGVAVPAEVQPDRTVRVTMPPRARGFVSIGVTSMGGSSERIYAYRYVDRPEITSMTPSRGSVLGGQVLLAGVDLVDVVSVEMTEQGLLPGPASTPLTFSAQPDETIVVQMPPHLPGTVFLRVTTVYGVSEAVPYQYGVALGE